MRAEKPQTPERRKLAAIMFTDIQGFTQKMNRRESMGFRLMRKHNEIMDAAVKKHGGRVVKSMGDSYLVAFDSVVNSVQCAIEAQEAFDEVNQSGALAEPLLVRISIHLGDIVVYEHDVFGDGVNIASHLQEVTPGGAIYVSQEIYAHARSKISGEFKSKGLCRIKGVDEPMEVYQVLLKGQKGRVTTPASPRPATAVVTTSKARWPMRWILVVVAVVAILAAAGLYFR